MVVIDAVKFQIPTQRFQMAGARPWLFGKHGKGPRSFWPDIILLGREVRL